MRFALATLLALAPIAAHAVERPSFLQAGDGFCTNEADFDDYVAHGRSRANSATETCQTITQPTRVAILGGQGGAKSVVRIMAGASSYVVGWTNGALPVP